MKKYGRIFFIHGVIFLVYFIALAFKFVYETSPNPVGHGMLLWLCMFIHLVTGVSWMVIKRKGLSTADIITRLAAIVFPMLLFIAFSHPFYELLWIWRGE